MTTNDVWNGNGNWTGNPTDWSLGSPPTSAESAEIASGEVVLTTTATVASVTLDPNSTLYLSRPASLTVTGGFTNTGGTLDVASSGSDGGGNLMIGGTLANTGTLNIGNSSLSAPLTVTAAGLTSTGTINLAGNDAVGTANEAILNITGGAPTILTGNLNIYGDALLEFKSGGIQTIAGGVGLLLDGANARASVGAGTTNSALTTLQTNAGTLDLEGDWNAGPGGASVTTSHGLANIGTLRVDDQGGAGGSTLTLGGVLYNVGATIIGNGGLSVPTIVTATSLAGEGNLTLQGNQTAYTNSRATLDITGAAPTSLTQNISLYGDADLTFASGGLQLIGPGEQLLMDGAESQISVAGGAANSALDSLATNIGTLDFEGNWNVGPGGVAVTTTVGFTNIGTFRIDVDGGAGDSLMSIGGGFNNYGTATIGNSTLSVSTTVTASGYTNAGTLVIAGSQTYRTINQATLDITGAAPATLTGSVSLYGDALLEFGSGGITGVGYNATLLLDGSQARISVGAGTTNSALSGLSSNGGTLNLEGNWNVGSGGVAVTTTTGFTNLGILYVDWAGGAGDSSLTIGGAITNAGFLNNTSATLDIGNTGLSAPTTVTATGLTSSGTINLYGNTALDSANRATLDITGSPPAVITGAWNVLGDALMEFAKGSVTTIGIGSSLQVDGAEAQISDSGGDANSALSLLASNYGTLTLRGDSGNGAGGGTFKTTVGLLNTATVNVDQDGGDGGTSVTIGGGLTNSGTISIGNGSLSANTTVTATGLTNEGVIDLQGNVASTATDKVTLDITGAAPTSLQGTVYVRGDTDLAFASGSITSVAAAAFLELDGAEAVVSDGLGTTNSALTKLATVTGRLLLRGNSNYGGGGESLALSGALTITGEVDLDEYGGDGGSTLTINSALTSSGTFIVGNTGLSAATTVTAASFTNQGSFYLDSDSTNSSKLTVTGGMTNYGTANIGSYSVLDIADEKNYAQSAGTTTVAGTLEATTINDNGGLIDFTGALIAGDGTGALNIYGGATMEFGAAVDTSHKVTFGAPTGTLELGAAGSFAGTIAGFSGNDAIDLLNTAVTGLAYSGQVLTVSGSSGTLATLTFSGSYTTSSFIAVSDGHGGTDILLAPASQWIGGNGNWTTSSDWSSVPNSTDDAVIAASGGYTVSVSTAITVGSVDITDTGATLAFNAPSLTDKVVGNLVNDGGVSVDSGGSQGGTTVTIGGAFDNMNQVTLGNSSLDAATTVTAASLFNSGTINLWGNNALAPSKQVTLDITGAAPTTLGGNLYVHGDALVEFGSGGITTIASGSELQLDGINARLSIGAGTTNSALGALSTVAGTFDEEGNWSTGPGGSTVTTTVGLTNSGTLDLDVYGGDGASKLTIGGTLTNSGAMTIGNSTLSASTTIMMTALSNSGSINLWGNEALTTTDQATLDVTGAAPTILTGKLYVHGDSLVEFGSGGISTIAAGAELQLDGVHSRLSIGAGTTNSALASLATVAGIFDMEGNWSTGPGGSVVTTTVAMTNRGTLELDVYGGDGTSSLTIGGTLTNTGTVTIGNNGLSANTTVSATGLINNGTIVLWGNDTLGTTNRATLDITGAGPGILSGSLYLHGDAMVEFASGGINSIAAGVELQLDGAQSVIESGGVAGNSAFSSFYNNAGTFDMEGNWSTGPGGSVVTTKAALTNTGSLDLDVYGGDGDSSLTIGGGLTNHGVVDIGNGNLTNNTTVSATSLTNEGVIDLQGNVASTTTDKVTLDITGAAPASLQGVVYVRGDADLAFASGSITSVAAAAFLELDGAKAVVSDGLGTTNSALSGLTTVTGRLLLRGNSNFGAGAESLALSGALTITGEVDLDEYGGDGGSTLTIHSALTSSGTFIVGNTGLSAATTVTAASFTNQGSFYLDSDSTNSSRLTVTGGMTNDGTVNIGSYSVLDIADEKNYAQSAGTTTIAGTLEATTINDNGGLIDFTGALVAGDGTGALNIDAGATMEFGAAVDASHTVTFGATSGELELGSPAGFAGTIAGFSGSDVIDLLGTTVTSLSYSGNTLTLSDGATIVATLTFSGTYTASSFTLVSDGHGGTDIVDPAAASKPSAATSQLHQLVQSVAAFGAGSGSADSIHSFGQPLFEPPHVLASVHA